MKQVRKPIFLDEVQTTEAYCDLIDVVMGVMDGHTNGEVYIFSHEEKPFIAVVGATENAQKSLMNAVDKTRTVFLGENSVYFTVEEQGNTVKPCFGKGRSLEDYLTTKTQLKLIGLAAEAGRLLGEHNAVLKAAGRSFPQKFEAGGQ